MYILRISRKQKIKEIETQYYVVIVFFFIIIFVSICFYFFLFLECCETKVQNFMSFLKQNQNEKRNYYHDLHYRSKV